MADDTSETGRWSLLRFAGCVSLLITLIFPGTLGYDVVLPSGAEIYPVYLNFSLLPTDAWTYVISDVWSDFVAPDHNKLFGGRNEENVTKSSTRTWQGVVAWDATTRSLRIDATVLKLVSSAPLTVIIEAKRCSLVSLIPLTIHSPMEKVSEKAAMTADYPHVIQSYRSRQTCYSPMTADASQLLNLKHLVPEFIRGTPWSVKVHPNPDLIVRHTKAQDILIWPTRGFCSQLKSYTVTLEYQVAGLISGSQTVGLVFVPEEAKNDMVVKHRHRRHRRTRATAFAFPESFYTAYILEDVPAPAYVVKLNVSSYANKPIKFSMTALMDSRSQALFSVDSDSGVVQTEALLDREAIAQHSFRVMAVLQDGSPAGTATTTLLIKVVDVNDNMPIFEKTDYDVTISESAVVGSVVVTVHAMDGDEFGNGQVTYSLLNPKGKNEAFQIDAKSGVITTRLPLDRELVENVLIYVKAEDEGRDDLKKSSIAKVTIKILDENDNTPSITNNTCNLDVREDVDWSTLPTIAQLQAEDKDHGLNGQIRYSIIGGNPNGQFILDAVTGDLKVAAPLDYESERKYRLLIRTQDLGTPPRSNTTLCNINILDMNDNQPIFSTEKYLASLAEDAHVGYPVVQTRAYDNDDGPKGKIVYSIKNQSNTQHTMPFVIDTDSGWITTSTRLDRERKDRYEFTVDATDMGAPPRSSTASVIITILDINDNGPIFEFRDYNVSISEGALQGTQIVTVRATDRDLNARLTYQIIKGNEDNRFNIINQNGLGLILLTKTVNYRRSQQCQLLVEVADESGKNDRVTVTVHILAANLHRPTFVNAPFRIQIPENTPVGTTVIELKALDEDVGENGRITYSVSGDVSAALTESFYLNPETGMLTTRKSLNREAVTVYTIPVTATDHGAPALYDTTDVLVELLDINDNAPSFTQKAYFVAVKEDVSPHTSIMQVSAVDPDFGLNGLVRYTFEGGSSANGTFSIDSTLGIIRTSRPLDREAYNAYELIVVAVDRGEPVLSSSVTVSVKVLDVNDNAPVFPSDVLNFYAPENLTMGSTVAEILAYDADDGPNAVVEYSIIGGPDADSFALVTRPDTPPLLSNLIELDHESNKKQYKLVIRASSPPLQTDVTVNIFVTDINDHAPVLKDFRVILNNYPRQFPHGVIGKVPVTDRDATAKLEYIVVSGNKHSLLLVNPTNGDIQLSASLNSDLAYSAKFIIHVSDGLNTVSATCTLSTIPVDQEMLASSVTLRSPNLAARDLLDPVTFDRLTEGLAFVTMCSPESVFIFSIIDETDTSSQTINITFAAKQSVTSQKFMSPDYLKERLYLHRDTFYNMTFVEILPFDDNLCLREPCPNFETCSTVQKFGKVDAFIGTDSFFFRSVQPVTTFDCECPTGYTGMTVHYSCDTEINLCYSKPCGTNGTCVSTEGGYHCVCQNGFTGSHCEIDLVNSDCYDGICHDPAVCTSKNGRNVECTGCPDDGFHTPFCELTTRSFSALNKPYMVFSGLRSRNRFAFSLSFATTRKTGLLLYNGRHSENTDFIALEVVNGSIQFSFSLGREKRRTVVPVMIADGDWHRVQVNYFNKTAKITVDDCDEVLSLHHGSELDYNCAAVVTHYLDAHCANSGALCHRFLDLTGPLYLGGIPDSQNEDRISSRFFDGCIENLELNQKRVDLNDFIEEFGTLTGCPQKNDHCGQATCNHGGTCVNGWENYHCNCPIGFSGDSCMKEGTDVFQLEGDGYMVIQAGVIVPVTLDLSFEFRTTKTTGTLTSFKLNDKIVVTVHIQRQYISAKAGMNEAPEGEIRVTDGRWHKLRIHLQHGTISLLVDGTREFQFSLPQADLKDQFSIVLGGDESLIGPPRGFNGCIRTIHLAGRKSSPSFRSNVRDGCADPEHHCESSPCRGEFSQCLETTDSYKCSCSQGFIGKHCKDICSYDPCQNGICVHSSENLHGYQCRCFANFTGKYCEERVPQSCPAAWWGYPVCGPCKCDVTKGFDPRCDRRTGACHCKDNFYQPVGSDQCVECGCYSKGSVSNQCDADGQCSCRTGVLGVHCDSCSNDFAEVTEDGCETVYGACPRAFAEGIWWERTNFGITAFHACPRNGIGKAMRLCDPASKLWEQPNLRNCTSLPFEVSGQLLHEFEKGLLGLNTFVAVRIVSELHTALNKTLSRGPLHVRDLTIANDLLVTILEYEILQSGMNLTHRLDKNYLPELLDSVSQVLDSSNHFLWRSLPYLESLGRDRTPSLLTHLLQVYIKTIAEHFHDTYMDSFEIITRNIKTGINMISIEDNAVLEFPRIHPAGRAFTQIRVAVTNLSVSDRMIYYVEYADLPSVLPAPPNSANLSKDSVAASRAFVFGVLHPDQIPVPALYQFELVRSRFLVAPQCVRWDFHYEKWITDGCSTFSINATHINCSCLPELLVVVISENYSFVNVFRFGLPVFLFNTVVFVLSLVLNVVSLALLLAARSKSDTICIYLNIIFTAFIADLFFVFAADLVWGAFMCKIVAVTWHYFFLSRMWWCAAHSLHIYRSVHATKDHEQERIRFYMVLGYALPAVVVGFSVGLRADGYGAEDFCWLLVDDHLILSLVAPAIGIMVLTLLLLSYCQCLLIARRKPSSAAQNFAEIRRNVHICTGICLFFIMSLVLAIIAIGLHVAALGFVYPAVTFFQSIFLFIFLCLNTPEVASLMDEKFVWFVRRKLDSLTSGNKNNKMNSSVCDTYRNPGISISESTTYHRTQRPDKDISGTFGRNSSHSTLDRSNHTLTHHDALLDSLGMKYPDSQKESDGTNEDTVSVQSTSTQEKPPNGDTLASHDSDNDSEYTAFRGHRGQPNIYRPGSSGTTFGTQLGSWNSLPHNGRNTAVKSPTCYTAAAESQPAQKQLTTFATFRPHSKASQGAGPIIDTVTGEILVSDSESAIQIPPPEMFRSVGGQRPVVQDIINTEGGTAV